MGSCLSRQDDFDEDSSRNHCPTGAALDLDNTLPDRFSGRVTSKKCRMCFEEQISGDDPVVPLGCMCLGDNSLAHESCIRKWFPQRLLETGHYDCEICKAQLGNRAISISMQGLQPNLVYQHLFQLQITLILETLDLLENDLALYYFSVLNRLSTPSEQP